MESHPAVAFPLIHPETKQLNVIRLVHELTVLRDRIIDEKAALQRDFPKLNADLDARLGSFSKLQNVLNSVMLGGAFWVESLLSPEWWSAHTTYPEPDRKIMTAEFQMFLKIGLVQSAFSAIESSLRIFLRAIDSSAHSGGTEFKRIYDELLLKRLAAPRPTHVELLDMLSRTRNTVHNNGIYFHRSGKDATQTYRGQTYTFAIGKPVNVAGWPLLLELISDLISMLTDVVRDSTLSHIAGDIVDPASLVKAG